MSILSVSSRRGPGQEYVKSSLGSVIEDLVDMTDPLELHPIKVTVILESFVIMVIVVHTYCKLCRDKYNSLSQDKF